MENKELENMRKKNQMRRAKDSANLLCQKQPKFGIAFDVDGVLARGTLPIPTGKEAMSHLVDGKGDFKVPVTFVTNALNRDQDKANQISGWFDIPIDPKQMIQAPGPLSLFKKVHKKHCLVVGQGKVPEIAKELGFTNICSVQDIAEHYPLLDMVNHDNRRHVAQYGFTEKEFPRVEAVILMGEPKNWESSLQLIVDILKTDGVPNKVPECVPEKHLPVIACNMDLQFMDRACMPRYGHGAYLLCLEALYKKVTGYELKYTSLVGKPSETTFRFAEHKLSTLAKEMGHDEPLERMYLIGDTPEVDIVGANLYQRYIDRLHKRRNNIDDEETQKNPELIDPELPQSRNIPPGTDFLPQTVTECQGVLVETGVYKPGQSPEKGSTEKNYRGHRDFPYINELYKPAVIVDDVLKAIEYILDREQISFQ